MATIFRALMTAVLLLHGYVMWNGWQASAAATVATPAAASATGATGAATPTAAPSAAGSPAPAAGTADSSASALHARTGLVVSILAALAQSVPFAYFLGTGFWVKAFVRASRADGSWELRQRSWLRSRAFVVMSLAPLATLAAAITGGMAGSGTASPAAHALPAALAMLASLVALAVVPPQMQRNSALMDELAERHQVPKPGTAAAEELIAFEETRALPPLFQLSRVMMFAGCQLVVIWLYLRYGTDGWRTTPLLPFGIGCLALVVAGLGLNASHDPDKPRPAPVAWARALAVGILGAVLLGLALAAGA
ncbi:MAG TPA: hypothetical protein VK824_05025 [Planctomycetota bacterium]|nr:hypothetical protein [Planctomycetota bacterium]